MCDKIDYEKAAIYYADKYKKTAEHNRQLIDDIEKADSDYFKMKKNRDEWKDAFYKSVDGFKKLSEICDRLITARGMIEEELEEAKSAADAAFKKMDAYKKENDDLKDALETTEDEFYSAEDEIERCENIIMALTKENKKLKEMIQLCGSY